MDDIDPSSTAARSALTEHSPPEKSGFFRRIVTALSPSDPDEDGQSENPAAPDPRSTHGMMNLRRMRVEDVAVPKADIVSVPVTITRDDLVEMFRESGLTRLPVYNGTLDTPVGMVHLKDFALKHGFNGTNGGKGGRFSLKAMLRPLLFVPPSMPIGVLLTKMQAERRHMALVIDEYGGVDGLVTIEDLIEQVIGEIEDEHDIGEDKYWTEEKPGCYLALAKTPLEEFQSEIGMDLTATDEVDEEEIDTLGGLVFMLAGHVPARGEMVPHPEGPEFEVVDADPRRIKRLRVRLHGESAAKATPALHGE
ncbi:hemolysin family protein [Primorskyibacter aestuariivivens]|uniref:hemolysin family protein n=1 Tax=Primorskyibacter aestuariivivens TaxID=1888912 RepID=UPI0022FFCD1E|nr:hemolysin family protein [Primorskyibacter aestuariivivens]MDA7430031.1 hemolysin family protein [Primorskyibacter aestuariivivens]